RQRDRQLHQDRPAHPGEDHDRPGPSPDRPPALGDVGRRHHPDRPMSDAPPQTVTWRTILATAGVFFGAGIVSLSQRLLSVGLPDLRGALGLGVDEAAWLPTAFNMALMFMGPFTLYLAAGLGPRRLLLGAGVVFTLVSIVLPFAPGLRSMLVLQVI